MSQDPHPSARYLAPSALLPGGWRTNVRLEVAPDGTLLDVAPDGGGAEVTRLHGAVVPGMPNLHSHAFQRALAGLAESTGGPRRPHGAAEGGDEGRGPDTFWSWRERMYRFLERLGPDDVEAVASQVYTEMLEAGYTCVGEFHYLHHAPGGAPYDDPGEMSWRILAAARRAGIGLTHLPVLYCSGGFGGLEPEPSQARFVLDVEGALDLFARVEAECRTGAVERAGFSLHSLRAVPPDALRDALGALGSAPGEPRIHIHAAEQRSEVEGCMAWSGARPVEWLLTNAPVDDRWCVVHATHMDAAETSALARSGAVAGVCPTTEANLGDGLFSLLPYLEAGGVLGVGSDSNVSVSPVEELRWLEYGQRVRWETRNIGAVEGGSTGAELFRRAAEGGARALGHPVGALAAGRRADLVVLDSDHPILAGRTGDTLLDSWVFSGNRAVVRDVMVGGRWVVRDGRHPERDAIAGEYRRVVRGLAE